MECTGIREFLSAYMDNALDQDTCRLVEEHIAECKHCEIELLVLRRASEQLGALETVRAPGDFLEKLHRRVEKTSFFDRIRRALFVPAKIKVPLELAGVLATAVLVISIVLNNKAPEVMKDAGDVSSFSRTARLHQKQAPASEPVAEETKATRFHTAPPKPAIPGQGLALDSSEAEIRERAHYAEPVLEAARRPEMPAVAEHEEEPIELVLVLKKDRRDRGISAGSAGEAPKPALRCKERVGAAEKDEGVQDIRVLKKSEAKGKKDLLLPPAESIYAELKQVVESSGGRIISVQQDTEKNRTEYLAASIPPGNFSNLVNELRRLGTLQKNPSEMDQGRETVRVRIVISHE
ncbi:MAG: DUF2275 domain-containing protein [Pseudomonadota bacterium]